MIGTNRFEEIDLKGKRVKNIMIKEKFIWNNNLRIDSKGFIMLTTKN